MYRNILVVSDNIFLLQEFKSLSDELINDKVSFTYSISPFSDLEFFTEKFGEQLLVFDLKNSDDVEKILCSYDLVFSVHCKQLFPTQLVRSLKCINVHPGYNPINRGWYPQVFAIINETPVGATVHEIDDKLDHGPIIARAFVDQAITDTSKSLYDKILSKELELLRSVLPKIIAGTYETLIPEDEGRLYLKKDFNSLRKIDLGETVTVLELINKLRALTHGEYKNAYFVNPETGKKVYISIELSEDSVNW